MCVFFDRDTFNFDSLISDTVRCSLVSFGSFFAPDLESATFRESQFLSVRTDFRDQNLGRGVGVLVAIGLMMLLGAVDGGRWDMSLYT